MYFICHMVVIRPVLDICWSYVEIYMYMTNILTAVIPIQNRTIAYNMVNRDSNEKQVFKVPDNNVM